MADYIDTSMLSSRLDALDKGGTGAELDISDLESAIDDAQAEVDSALGVRYSVPFASPPPLIISLALDIAAWQATLTYYRGVELDVRDPVQLRYDRARRILADLAAGRATLPVVPPADPVPGVDGSGAGAVNPHWHDRPLFTGQDASRYPAPADVSYGDLIYPGYS